MSIVIERIGPQVTLQDAGRPGKLGIGLSRSGAVDRDSYIAALALMDAPLGAVALECAGFGGRFRFEKPLPFALTGAAMRASLNGSALDANATCIAKAGDILEIGAAISGVYGYCLFGFGIDCPEELGGRGLNEIGGVGQRLATGMRLDVIDGAEAGFQSKNFIPGAASASPIRMMPGPQSDLFSDEERQRFFETRFVRSAKANRQGVRLDYDGAPFAAGAQLSRVSEFICEGDIQLTGEGAPYVLLADCQTMGGYPRIGTVLPCDLPRIVQAELGQEVRFELVSTAEAERLWQSDESLYQSLSAQTKPQIRDPHEMSDLLSYELIGKPIDR